MTKLTVTEMDYSRISSLLESPQKSKILPTENETLESEIERARIVDFPEIPTDLVTMNSKLRYLNKDDGKIHEITLVYPQHASIEQKKISVTAPLGSALLGLREDDEIEWIFPDGKKKTIKVLEVIYQPEANGDLHL